MIRTTLGLALLTLLSTSVEAKIYKCKNAAGETYYSQTYDPKLCGGGGSQLNDQGVSVRAIERQKTPEEIAAEKAAAEKAAEIKAKADAEAKADQVLMMSYANEGDLQRAHDQELQMIDSSVATAKLQLANQQKALAEFLASAAESERAGNPVSEAVAANIATVRKQIEDQNAFIAEKDQEKAASAKAFAVKLERFRELKARQVQRPRQ